MLLWLFAIIFIIGVGLLIWGFRIDSDGIVCVGALIYRISGVVLAIMIFILGCMHTGIYLANRFVDKETYETLEYKVTSGDYCDESGALNEEVVAEVQKWNEEFKAYQALQDDFWVGIFYPNIFDQDDQFGIIDYEKYNVDN